MDWTAVHDFFIAIVSCIDKAKQCIAQSATLHRPPKKCTKQRNTPTRSVMRAKISLFKKVGEPQPECSRTPSREGSLEQPVEYIGNIFVIRMERSRQQKKKTEKKKPLPVQIECALIRWANLPLLRYTKPATRPDPRPESRLSAHTIGDTFAGWDLRLEPGDGACRGCG